MSNQPPAAATNTVRLRVYGLVERPAEFTFADLCALPAVEQVADVAALDPRRSGQAVTLAGLLAAVGVQPAARWLTLHAERDDFHASIPLSAVSARAVVIYRLHDAPLATSAGGPLRFFVPDHAACHVAEIDECANVKYLDALELTADRGHDNRPTTEAAHARLHEK